MQDSRWSRWAGVALVATMFGAAFIANPVVAGAKPKSKVLFEDPLKKASQEVRPYTNEAGDVAFKNGELIVTTSPGGLSQVVLPRFAGNGTQATSDVRIEVDVALGPNGWAGVACRNTDDSSYRFTITSTSFYGFAKEDPLVVTPLEEGAITLETVNHLVVECRGPKEPVPGDAFTAKFTINGTSFDFVDTDAPLANALVGLVAEPPLDASAASVSFSNLKITKLKPKT